MIIGQGEVVFLEEPEPRPDAGQVLCKPLSVGLCGTDKLSFSGEMPAVEYPRVPCHEVSAMVIDDNSSRGLQPGTAVCIDPYNSCGQCHACRMGRSNCCKFNQTLGVQRDGVLRERFVVNADRVYEVPNGSDPRVFCLTEPLALALHIVERAGDVQGRWCLVAGIGNVGKMVVSVLRGRGARIIAWSRSSENLHQARTLGADVVVGALDPDATTQVLDVTDGEGVAVAFETAGTSQTVEVCIKLAAYAGRVVLVGHSRQVSNVSGSEIVFKELDILGSRNSSGQFARAIEMLTRCPTPWREMISDRFSFVRSLEAFELTSSKCIPHGRIVIDFPD